MVPNITRQRSFHVSVALHTAVKPGESVVIPPDAVATVIVVAVTLTVEETFAAGTDKDFRLLAVERLTLCNNARLLETRTILQRKSQHMV